MSLTAPSGMDEQGLQTIGKYRVIGILGRGSMGIVYKGQDPQIGRVVAIKTMRKGAASNLSGNGVSLERFKMEARSAGNLRHPNIITIFDVNIEADMPYMVMDYVEGESLDQIIAKSGRIEPSLVLHYIREAALGIDYAHSQGVIHRDIKPSNIIVDQQQRAYLLDFGIASLNDSLGGTSERLNGPSEPIMGTPGYMSPEQILNEKIDQRSDLFSLAVVAFECFAGQRPFPGNNFSTVVANILNGKPQSLSMLAPELPLALEAELERALSRNRDERPATGAELVAGLRRALGLNAADEGAPGEKRIVPRRRRNSTWRNLSGVAGAEKANDDAVDQQKRAEDAALAMQWGTGGFRDSTRKAPEQDTKNFYAPTQEVLARSSSSLGDSGIRFKRRGSALRVLTVFFGLLCIFLAGYLCLSLLGKEPSAPLGEGERITVSEILRGSGDNLESVSVPVAAPVPRGKIVEEMNDKELLGVLLAKDQPEASVISALRQAVTRRISGFDGAVLTPLQSDSYLVRIEAVKAIAEYGDKRLAPALLNLLDDYDPLVREQAARALGALGSRASLGYLSARALKDDNALVKQAIKKAIDKINGVDNSK